MPKRYRLDRLEVPDLPGLTEAIGRLAMPEAVETVTRRAREVAPQSPKPHPNKLRDRIEGRIEDSGRKGIIAARAPHAHLVHDGTKSHLERAKKRAMVIPVTGGFVLRRTARHPGARAQPFLRRAAEDCREDLHRILRKAAERAMREGI